MRAREAGQRADGQFDVDPAAGAVVLDAAPSAQFSGPLPNRGQPDTGLPAGTEVDPVVVHRDLECSGRHGQPHHSRRRTRVPYDVGQRLGDDPVRGHLHGGRQFGQRCRRLDADPQRCIILTLPQHRLLAQRLHQSEAVQRRRPEVINQSADVLQRGRLVSQLDQQIRSPGRVMIQASERRLGVEDDAGEHRSEPVVQIPPEPPALLLPGGDHLLAGGTELLGERNRLDGRRYRGADQVQDARRQDQSGPLPAQPDDQLAEDLTALAQRRGVPGGRWIP